MVWKALTKFPWQMLVDHAPTIVDAARRMYVGPSTGAHRSGRERMVGLDALRRTVDELEAREVRHAAMIEDLAKQAQDLTMAIAVLRARVRWAWIGTAVALAVAAATALLVRR